MRNCLLRAISPFSHSVFCTLEELPAIFFEFDIVVCKLFQLEESKFCRLGKGLDSILQGSLDIMLVLMDDLDIILLGGLDIILLGGSGSIFTNHSQDLSWSCSPDFSKEVLEYDMTSDWLSHII